MGLRKALAFLRYLWITGWVRLSFLFEERNRGAAFFSYFFYLFSAYLTLALFVCCVYYPSCWSSLSRDEAYPLYFPCRSIYFFEFAIPSERLESWMRRRKNALLGHANVSTNVCTSREQYIYIYIIIIKIVSSKSFDVLYFFISIRQIKLIIFSLQDVLYICFMRGIISISAKKNLRVSNFSCTTIQSKTFPYSRLLLLHCSNIAAILYNMVCAVWIAFKI